ncbi:Uncharacterised protein [Mycobacteroides abscessus subsp. massiliense]|nr:Uncharacterised protein [Mycobacteroides abscessus subsp. massiliense]
MSVENLVSFSNRTMTMLSSLNANDTECSLPTSSSCGTTTLTMTVKTSHARMIGTEKVWMNRAMREGFWVAP